MKKNHSALFGIAALLTAAIFIFAGCDTGTGGGRNNTVTLLDLKCKVTAPVTCNTPDAAIEATAEYSGSVVWQT